MAVKRFWRNIRRAEKFANEHGVKLTDIDYDNMGAYVRFEPRKDKFERKRK